MEVPPVMNPCIWVVLWSCGSTLAKLAKLGIFIPFWTSPTNHPVVFLKSKITSSSLRNTSRVSSRKTGSIEYFSSSVYSIASFRWVSAPYWSSSFSSSTFTVACATLYCDFVIGAAFYSKSCFFKGAGTLASDYTCFLVTFTSVYILSSSNVSTMSCIFGGATLLPDSTFVGCLAAGASYWICKANSNLL